MPQEYELSISILDSIINFWNYKIQILGHCLQVPMWTTCGSFSDLTSSSFFFIVITGFQPPGPLYFLLQPTQHSWFRVLAIVATFAWNFCLLIFKWPLPSLTTKSVAQSYYFYSCPSPHFPGLFSFTPEMLCYLFICSPDHFQPFTKM